MPSDYPRPATPRPADLADVPSILDQPRREPRPAFQPEEGASGRSDWWRVAGSVVIVLVVIAGLAWLLHG